MRAVFEFSDYKKFLIALIGDAIDKKFRPNLISAIGCQKSFFSQVLNGAPHLTPDHAANIAAHLGWDDLTTEYFMTLVNHARAASPALKSRLRKRLDELRNQATQPSERLKWPSLKTSEIQSVYYSSWVFAAIHIIVAIPKYQTPEAIAEKLGLPRRRVQEVLSWLIQAKLIEKSQRGFSVVEASIHLKNSSHLNETHHTHWRNRALSSLQRNEPEALNYSAVFAASREDFDELKRLAMDFLKKATNTIAPSKSEEVYVLGLDLFPLGEGK